MNSHKPLYKDELGQLVHRTLEDKFGAQRPSRRVWKRIKEKLTGARSNSGQFFSLRSSLVVQVAILFLFLTLGGVNSLFEQKSVPLATRYATSAPQNNAPSPRTIVLANRELTNVEDIELPQSTEKATPPLDAQAAHLQDTGFKRQRFSHNNRHYEPPLVIPPVDVGPHINSPAGRTLMRTLNTQEIFAFFLGGQFDPGLIQ